MGKHRFVGDRHGRADRFGNLPPGTPLEREAEPDPDDAPPERERVAPARASALRRALGAKEPSKPTGEDTGSGH